MLPIYRIVCPTQGAHILLRNATHSLLQCVTPCAGHTLHECHSLHSMQCIPYMPLYGTYHSLLCVVTFCAMLGCKQAKLASSRHPLAKLCEAKLSKLLRSSEKSFSNKHMLQAQGCITCKATLCITCKSLLLQACYSLLRKACACNNMSMHATCSIAMHCMHLHACKAHDARCFIISMHHMHASIISMHAYARYWSFSYAKLHVRANA